MFKYLLSLYLNYCVSFTVPKSYAWNKTILRSLGKKKSSILPSYFFTACNIKSFWLCMTTEKLVRKIIKSLNSSLKGTFKLYASKDHNVLDALKREAKNSFNLNEGKKDWTLHTANWLSTLLCIIMNAQYTYSIVLTFIL